MKLKDAATRFFKAYQCTGIDMKELKPTDIFDSRDAVDVRSTLDFFAGRILGARNVPFDRIHLYGVRLYGARHLGTDFSAPVVFVSGSGQLSLSACRFAERAGYTNVYNLTGGMRAWVAAGLPVVSGL